MRRQRRALETAIDNLAEALAPEPCQCAVIPGLRAEIADLKAERDALLMCCDVHSAEVARLQAEIALRDESATAAAESVQAAIDTSVWHAMDKAVRSESRAAPVVVIECQPSVVAVETVPIPTGADMQAAMDSKRKGARRKHPEWVDDVIRDRFIEGIHWDDIAAELQQQIPTLTVDDVRSRALCMKLRAAQRKVQMVPKRPAERTVLVDTRVTTVFGAIRWTDAMNEALLAYADCRAQLVTIARLIELDFGGTVGECQVSDQLRVLGHTLDPSEARKGFAIARNEAAYALQARRFWSRDDITLADARRQLEGHAIYFRLDPSERTERPAIAYLHEGKITLADLVERARRKFGVDHAR